VLSLSSETQAKSIVEITNSTLGSATTFIRNSPFSLTVFITSFVEKEEDSVMG
jgi:hypothetical protein